MITRETWLLWVTWLLECKTCLTAPWYLNIVLSILQLWPYGLRHLNLNYCFYLRESVVNYNKTYGVAYTWSQIPSCVWGKALGRSSAGAEECLVAWAVKTKTSRPTGPAFVPSSFTSEVTAFPRWSCIVLQSSSHLSNSSALYWCWLESDSKASINYEACFCPELCLCLVSIFSVKKIFNSMFIQ